MSYRISNRRQFLIAATALGVPLFGALRSSNAQSSNGPPPYPLRPVRIINPFAAGGSLDILARIIAQKLQEIWGQSVIVDNRPGASTVIGINAVAQAEPDGYTLGLATNTFAMNAARMKNLPYDSRKDIVPVSILTETPFMLVVRADFPAKTLEELIDAARKTSGGLSYASIGNGTSPHIATEIFKRAANIDLTHVPYKGAAPALQDLLGGSVAFMFANVPDVVPYLDAGTLRALVNTSDVRSTQFPNVPTTREAGYPQIDIKSWYAMIAPKGTPPAIVEIVSASAARVLALPAVRQQLAKLELTPIGSSPEQLRGLLNAEFARFEKIVAEIGAEKLN